MSERFWTLFWTVRMRFNDVGGPGGLFANSAYCLGFSLVAPQLQSLLAQPKTPAARVDQFGEDLLGPKRNGELHQAVDLIWRVGDSRQQRAKHGVCPQATSGCLDHGQRSILD